MILVLMELQVKMKDSLILTTRLLKMLQNCKVAQIVGVTQLLQQPQVLLLILFLLVLLLLLF